MDRLVLDLEEILLWIFYLNDGVAIWYDAYISKTILCVFLLQNKYSSDFWQVFWLKHTKIKKIFKCIFQRKFEYKTKNDKIKIK